MSKRIIALLLCVLMLVPALASCSTVDEDNPGAYITMYLTDEIYDFDPARAYYNSGAVSVVSLMFDTLFKLDDNGKVKKSLVDDYEIIEDEDKNEYAMVLTLSETYWSNGQSITAEDVIFAWRRLLNQENSYAAASLLYDIKNARAIKEGDESIDDLGVEPLKTNVLKITFEGPIDYDQFMLNLTSLATAPLPENIISQNSDWAKGHSSIITSGPFKLGKIQYAAGTEEVEDDNALKSTGKVGNATSLTASLDYFFLERNPYYYRDPEKDALDKSVTPYRLLVDCSMSEEKLLKEFEAGRIFYIGDIPLSLRNKSSVKEQVETSNALSTTVVYLNQNVAPFENVAVRQALSLVIDRNAIAKSVVYAEAATALVPPGVFDAKIGKTKEEDQFRAIGGKLISTSANKPEALRLLNEAGINPAEYSFTLSVAAYDDVHQAIALQIVAAWQSLGFNVSINYLETIQNNDYLKVQETTPTSTCDDLFTEAIERGKFDAILFDSTAYSADAYSMLSSYAKSFSGMALSRTDVTVEVPVLDRNGNPEYNKDGTPKTEEKVVDYTYELGTHLTGYDSERYNLLMEAVYYIPYFKNLKNTDYDFLGDDFYTPDEFKTLHAQLKTIYKEYNITVTDDEDEWAEQRTKLLHAAEKLLMKDMPVIPIVFNQNAVLVSEDLKKIDATYYSPMGFTKMKLKDYLDYTYTLIVRDANGSITEEKTVSIFEDFPDIYWSKMGDTEDPNKK
ncbi:MAG: hypothetical protein IJW30_03200 [Clostridia bacterium]|nr:hypothetical protein [Clostridia bacterium]